MKSDHLVSRLAKIAGMTLAAAAGMMALKEVAGLWRYVNIKRMAKRHDGASPGFLPAYDSPQYAQAPRRARAYDPHRGRERQA
ncbi:MAG TPA: hypothetical protein VGL81_06870 [Polyangiaceae bacterium]|jgi:hypothetical protein